MVLSDLSYNPYNLARTYKSDCTIAVQVNTVKFTNEHPPEGGTNFLTCLKFVPSNIVTLDWTRQVHESNDNMAKSSESNGKNAKLRATHGQ